MSLLCVHQFIKNMFQLPLKVDIIKHKHEIDGKSTAGHAAVLAPNDVSIYIYPDIPNYENENVALVFPSQNAISVSQLVNGNITESQNLSLDELPKGYNRSTLMTKIPKSREEYEFNGNGKELQIDKVIFIDSTWNQSKSIFKDERIKEFLAS